MRYHAMDKDTKEALVAAFNEHLLVDSKRVPPEAAPAFAAMLTALEL